VRRIGTSRLFADKRSGTLRDSLCLGCLECVVDRGVGEPVGATRQRGTERGVMSPNTGDDLAYAPIAADANALL